VRAGDELGPSRWLEIDQRRIDAYAAATDDAAWIQANRRRLAEGQEGATVVPGFLTLSLLAGLWFELTEQHGHPVTINYGVNRVRFPAPVPVGGRVRASFRVEEVTAVDGGRQARITSTVECEGGDKPVCVAELVFRFLS
jgi:acyl dehydratase